MARTTRLAVAEPKTHVPARQQVTIDGGTITSPNISFQMKVPSILKVGEVLLPSFGTSLVDIGANRKIVVFDSHHPDNKGSVQVADTKEEDKKLLPVVFLHGFPDNAMSARSVASKLVASTGRRCLLFSCPGYDTTSSAAPAPKKGSLTPESVARDYITAIDAVLGRESSFHLVGHDWGAVHGSAMAREKEMIAERRVASLCMAAVPHNFLSSIKRYPYAQIQNSWYIAFFQLPILPELWLRYGGGIEWLWRKWSPGYNYYADDCASNSNNNNESAYYFDSVSETLLSQDRVLRSALQMYRETMGIGFLFQWLLLQVFFGIRWFLGMDNDTFRFLPLNKDDDVQEEAACCFSMPIMGITGENDGCIDTRLFSVGMKPTAPAEEPGNTVYPRGCTLLRIPNAGHFVFAEAPDAVAEALQKFMTNTTSLN